MQQRSHIAAKEEPWRKYEASTESSLVATIQRSLKVVKELPQSFIRASQYIAASVCYEEPYAIGCFRAPVVR